MDTCAILGGILGKEVELVPPERSNIDIWTLVDTVVAASDEIFDILSRKNIIGKPLVSCMWRNLDMKHGATRKGHPIMNCGFDLRLWQSPGQLAREMFDVLCITETGEFFLNDGTIGPRWRRMYLVSIKNENVVLVSILETAVSMAIKRKGNLNGTQFTFLSFVEVFVRSDCVQNIDGKPGVFRLVELGNNSPKVKDDDHRQRLCHQYLRPLQIIYIPLKLVIPFDDAHVPFSFDPPTTLPWQLNSASIEETILEQKQRELRATSIEMKNGSLRELANITFLTYKKNSAKFCGVAEDMPASVPALSKSCFTVVQGDGFFKAGGTHGFIIFNIVDSSNTRLAVYYQHTIASFNNCCDCFLLTKEDDDARIRNLSVGSNNEFEKTFGIYEVRGVIDPTDSRPAFRLYVGYAT